MVLTAVALYTYYAFLQNMRWRVQRGATLENNRSGLKTLTEPGISTTVYYPTLMHLQPIYAGLEYRHRDLPETERAAKEALSLPMSAELTEAQMERVAKGIAKTL